MYLYDVQFGLQKHLCWNARLLNFFGDTKTSERAFGVFIIANITICDSNFDRYYADVVVLPIPRN